MRILFAIIINVFLNTIVSQNGSIKIYTFFNKYDVINSNSYIFTRQFISDFIFIEKGIFSVDTSNVNAAVTYKIIKNDWYIKNKNKWSPFFLNGKSSKSIIRINKLNYRVKWAVSDCYDSLANCKIYNFRLIPVGFTLSTNPIYYFTSKDGIIAIDNDNSFLVREDKKYLPLDKN